MTFFGAGGGGAGGVGATAGAGRETATPLDRLAPPMAGTSGASAGRRGVETLARSDASLCGSVHETDRAVILATFLEVDALFDFGDQSVEHGGDRRGPAAQKA